MRVIKLFLICICVYNTVAAQSISIDIQGHRGARGMMPENTIPAFIYALDQGVTTLELDVAITKDGQVVVTHEPWISHANCLKPDSTKISESDEKSLNIYKMTYEEVSQFDCGSLPVKRFPEQEKIKTSKPLLSDVIKSAEWHIKSYSQFEVDYNIELKSSPAGDNTYHPTPKEFSKIVYDLIDQYLPWERVIIQSFDFRVLRYWNENYPEVRLAALVENSRSVETNLASLGFKPAIYSPYYKLLSKKKIEKLHEIDIKVIPWTVNNPEEMLQLVEWGVDGIITDYPNRAKNAGLTPQQTTD
ncbi:glycerophosphodiester phosphodiesterase [Fulvivirga sp. RKSG066]|uniref:glycerophosphodiester phosphodiesterase n=1 Tax=Fulvivirga aurantia TaxID=2529383 RepID=UPI0012BD4CC5|nr:glycerophosphodiester phosphodiesterase [Fulvivirga aurantia]MTI21452.1 glycerophosphodiester phosphodiesterase [Fulvivirga aurantia]